MWRREGRGREGARHCLHLTLLDSNCRERERQRETERGREGGREGGRERGRERQRERQRGVCVLTFKGV